MRLLTIKEVQEMQLNLMKKLHAFFVENDIRYYMIGGSALGAVRHNGFIPWDDDIDIGLFREDYEKFLSISHLFSDEYDVINFEKADNCDFNLIRIYFKDTLIDIKSIEKTKLDKRLYLDIFPLDNVPDDASERDAFEQKINRINRLTGLIDVRCYNKSFSQVYIKKFISLLLTPFRSFLLKKADDLIKTYRYTSTDTICSICSQYSFAKQAMPKEIYGKPVLCVFEDDEFYIPEQVDNYLSHLYGSDYMQVPPESKRRKGHDIYILSE